MICVVIENDVVIISKELSLSLSRSFSWLSFERRADPLVLFPSPQIKLTFGKKKNEIQLNIHEV